MAPQELVSTEYISHSFINPFGKRTYVYDNELFTIGGLFSIKRSSIPLEEEFSPPYEFCVHDLIGRKIAFVDVDSNILFLNVNVLENSEIQVIGEYFSDTYIQVNAHPSPTNRSDRSYSEHSEVKKFYSLNRGKGLLNLNLEEVADQIYNGNTSRFE
jgi:hypothetical protein